MLREIGHEEEVLQSVAMTTNQQKNQLQQLEETAEEQKKELEFSAKSLAELREVGAIKALLVCTL